MLYPHIFYEVTFLLSSRTHACSLDLGGGFACEDYEYITSKAYLIYAQFFTKGTKQVAINLMPHNAEGFEGSHKVILFMGQQKFMILG